MRLSERMVRVLFLVAAIIGCVQGLLTFIGGIAAAEDASPSELNVQPLWTNGTYWCGMVRAEGKGACEFDRYDRGWFKRVYVTVREGINIGNKTLSIADLKGLVGYEAVLSYAIFLGLGWVGCGAFGLWAYWGGNRRLALIVAGLYGVLYLVHIGLFAAIWNSVRKVQDDCKPFFDIMCPLFRDLVTQSSKELLGYAICAFITILYSGAATVLYALSSPVPRPSGIQALPQSTNTEPSTQVVAFKDMPNATQLPLQKLDTAKDSPMRNLNEEQKHEPLATSSTLQAPGRSSPTLQALATQFIKLHRYLGNDEKLRLCAAKNVAKLEKNPAGQLPLGPLKAHLMAMLLKKGYPSLSDLVLDGLTSEYQKDRSQGVEPEQFKRLLGDVFAASRLELAKKYAVHKAPVLKASKSSSQDKAGATKLEEMLKQPQRIFEELLVVIKELAKDKNEVFALDEVTELCRRFCGRYALPTFVQHEIKEVMEDIDRNSPTLLPVDLRLVVLTVLAIGTNLVLNPE